MKRRWQTAVLMFFLWSVHPVQANDRFPVVEPPKCVNNLGEPVQFNRRSQAQGGFAAGRAFRDAEGVPSVTGLNFHRAAPEFQAFIDRHECAHHEVGDVDRPHPPRNSPARCRSPHRWIPRYGPR